MALFLSDKVQSFPNYIIKYIREECRVVDLQAGKAIVEFRRCWVTSQVKNSRPCNISLRYKMQIFLRVLHKLCYVHK